MTMLSILGQHGSPNSYCDRESRRSFLKIGGMSFGATAFGLSDVLRAEAAQGKSNKHKAIIQIFLGGGPPHQDMWEIKTDAPSEIRGEFRPIPTNVPGIQICEVFPKLAQIMDKAVVIRSIVGCKDRHESFQCMSGWQTEDLRSLGGRPSMGAAISKMRIASVLEGAMAAEAGNGQRSGGDSASRDDQVLKLLGVVTDEKGRRQSGSSQSNSDEAQTPGSSQDESDW